MVKSNRYLFQLNHPAHFHLFKNLINELKKRGHQVKITIKQKDVLKALLDEAGWTYENIAPNYRKNKTVAILKSLYDRDKKLLQIVREFQPNLMLGTSPEIGHISLVTRIPSFFFGEDDVNLSKRMYAGALLCYPFFTRIISPNGCNNKQWNSKTVFYPGYQKLAYLHPNWFKANQTVTGIKKPYFILRFSELNAYHDKNKSGISYDVAQKLIEILKPNGNILISSEGTLHPNFKKYEFSGAKSEMHNLMANSDMIIADSQSMIVESAMLGIPNIRFNNFAGKISVLNELENRYKLTRSISSEKEALLYKTVKEFLKPETKSSYINYRNQMLQDKTDVTHFFIELCENYDQIDSYKSK